MAKLINLYLILVLSTILMTGFSAYASQMSVYREESETNLRMLVLYLADLMQADGSEFIAYQDLMLEYGDRINIPYDYDGDHRETKKAFYKLFSETYPGKTLGVDVDYKEMTEELKILYATYKHEYWLHIFESASRDLSASYTYYLVPTGEDYNAYYMIDAIRELRLVGDKQYIELNIEVYHDPLYHDHLWEAWESGEYTDGMDITDNEFGRNYAYSYPLWIKGQKIGVVCAEMNIETVNTVIIKNVVRQLLLVAVLVTALGLVLVMLIGRRYIARLITLKGEIQEFTDTKDPMIADRISKDITGDDEIHDLAYHISVMIRELSGFMKTLMDKNRELTEAHDKIRAANELAIRDTLTGIRNKTAYDNEVVRIKNRMKEEGFTKFGIAMVDLNFLKHINDTYGHEKGNMAIKRICQIICVSFSHSPVFRIGGDEFVVVLMNSDYDEVEDRIKFFRDKLHELDVDENLNPWEKVSAAIGYSMFDPAIDTGIETVFKRADNLMYEDKKAMKAERE